MDAKAAHSEIESSELDRTAKRKLRVFLANNEHLLVACEPGDVVLTLQEALQQGAPSASTEMGPPGWFKEWELKVENIQQELRSRGSQDMSAASVEAAEQVLSHLGIAELSDAVPPPPEEFEAMGMDPFPMHQYVEEKNVYDAYAKCLEGVLKANELLGPEQYAVQIIASDAKLTLPSGSTVFKGFLDLAVAPDACMGYSILQQMRVGLELKHTKAHKDAFKAAQRRKKENEVEQPNTPGLSFASNPKAQAILELLASRTVVQHPIVLFLTDGTLYHRLRLTPRVLYVARDLELRSALCSMCQSLKAASRNPLFSLQEHRAQLTNAEDAEALDKIREERLR